MAYTEPRASHVTATPSRAWLKVLQNGAENPDDVPEIVVYRGDQNGPTAIRGRVVGMQEVPSMGTALVMRRSEATGSAMVLIDLAKIVSYDLPASALALQTKLLDKEVRDDDLTFSFVRTGDAPPTARLAYEIGSFNVGVQTTIAMNRVGSMAMESAPHFWDAVEELEKHGTNMVSKWAGLAYPSLTFNNATGADLFVKRVRFPVIAPRKAYALQSDWTPRYYAKAKYQEESMARGVAADSSASPSTQQMLMDDWESPDGSPIVLTEGRHSRAIPPVAVAVVTVHAARLDGRTDSSGMPILAAIVVSAEDTLLPTTLLLEDNGDSSRLGEGVLTNRLHKDRPFSTITIGWNSELEYRTTNKSSYFKGGPYSHVTRYGFSFKNGSKAESSVMFYCTLNSKRDEYDVDAFRAELVNGEGVMESASFRRLPSDSYMIPGFIAMGEEGLPADMERYVVSLVDVPRGGRVQGSLTVRTRRA